MLASARTPDRALSVPMAPIPSKPSIRLPCDSALLTLKSSYLRKEE
jgi:hypothetical protein